MFLSQDEWEEKTLDLFKEDVLYKPKNINTIYLYLYIDIYIYVCFCFVAGVTCNFSVYLNCIDSQLLESNVNTIDVQSF